MQQPKANIICRACLSTKSNIIYDLNELKLRDVYELCTSIKVSLDDNISKSVCCICYDVLNRYFEFKQMCVKSNETLTSLYSSSLVLKKEEQNSLHDFEDECISNVSLNEDQCVSIKEENNELKQSETESLLDYTAVVEDLASTKHKDTKIKPTRTQKLRVGYNHPCNLCNRKFKTTDRLQIHKQNHGVKLTSVTCEQCNKTFTRWASLQRHIECQHTVVNLSKLQCAVCGTVCKNTYALARHSFHNHQDTRKFMCHLCGKEFKNKRALDGHLATHEQNRIKSHVCQHCKSTFYSKQDLSTHINKRHRGIYFICDLCKYPFKDKSNLVKHIHSVHEHRKLFKCTVCSKKFSCSNYLIVHMRYHSGETPYECRVCGKRFVTKKMVVDHHRIHSGEKPFKCDQCSQAFAQGGTLNRHKKKLHSKPDGIS